VILRLEETLGFNHTRPWSQGRYFPCANWSLAKKKKKTTIIEILVGEEGSGIAPSVVSSVGCGY
jgi:hypothetical protein